MVFGALLFSTLAVLVFSLLLALYFWPTDYRYWALGVLVVLYAGLGVGLFPGRTPPSDHRPDSFFSHLVRVASRCRIY